MSKVFTITDGLENMGALRTGGQGSVYKGRRIGPIITAVKLIPTPIHTESADDKNYRNFQSEVEKLKKVNEEPNPNVVKILNHGITESGSFPFIEMEFIEGPDLEDLLKPPHEKLFTVREVVRVADQLANALAHCHKVQVKHGDIKSNNIKFNINSNNYILLDFGLSIMSDDQRRTSMRHAGAIEFMAPEQNEGAMYFQTDIYSYGIILFELLAGQVPFPLHDNGETSRNSVMLAHMESPVPDLMTLRRLNLPETWTYEKKQHEMQVPAWLIKIISRCLEKQPENRYKNGIALQEAIVHESMLPNTQVQNTAELYALQQENERLQALALHYQDVDAARQVDNKTDTNRVLLKKPLFVLLLIMLLGFGAFSSYILFDRGWAKKIYHHFFKIAPVKAEGVKLDTPFTPRQNQPESAPVTIPTDTLAQVHKDTNSMSPQDRQALLDSIKKDDTSKNLHF